MDIERAEDLTRQARAALGYYDIHWLMYDEDSWDPDAGPIIDGVDHNPGPDLLPGVTPADVHCMGEAEMALAWAGTPPGRAYLIVDDEEVREPDPDRGDHPYLPSLTLTEGLARARVHLSNLRADAKPELREHAHAALKLVDEALAALDLAPDDPIVGAAVQS